MSIMKLFQEETPDPENYAILYLDVFGESLTDRKPWLKANFDWADAVEVFKVRTENVSIRCRLFGSLESEKRSSVRDRHVKDAP